MNLSPTETASRFGVSVKALRLYERRGLLTPLRSESGWRTYGPDQIARLHQILALKRLGLPLAGIAQLLANAGTFGRGARAAGTTPRPRQRQAGPGPRAAAGGARQARGRPGSVHRRSRQSDPGVRDDVQARSPGN